MNVAFHRPRPRPLVSPNPLPRAILISIAVCCSIQVCIVNETPETTSMTPTHEPLPPSLCRPPHIYALFVPTWE